MTVHSEGIDLIRLSRFLIIFLAALLLIGSVAAADTRPNILLIISDDQRYDDLNDDVMPITKQRIFDQGVTFTNGYITTPACCPSRSSIFTGLYASRHKVITNEHELRIPTIIPAMKQAGYVTGIIGKYLNTWDGRKRKEFDFWAVFPGGSSRYYNPVMHINGKVVRPKGYITHIVRDRALKFLEDVEKTTKPFFLIMTPNAPHYPTTPDPESEGLFELDSLSSPNLNEDDVSDKPAYVRNQNLLDTPALAGRTSLLRRQRRCLWSLDLAIGEVLNRLELIGKLDNTLVIFISDNGEFRGEHRLASKDAPYQEAVRVPFGMRYPPTIPAGTIKDEIVANIDIAPTIGDLAEVSPSIAFDGLSLLTLFEDTHNWRSDLLIEDWRKAKNQRFPWVGLITPQYKYIRNQGDIDELYDLSIDPYELNNLQSEFTIKDTLSLRLDQVLLAVRGSTSFSKPKGKIGVQY